MEKHSKHLSADERKAATVEAVIDLAAEKNPNEITTHAIAKHMGLTQGAIFRHFPNKEAILQAVMTWVSKRLLARMDKAIEGIDSPVAALEAMFIAHVNFIVEHPGVPRMLFGELQNKEQTLPKKAAQTLLGQYRERVTHLLEQGKQQGEFAEDLDISAAVLLFVGSIQGLVVQSLLIDDVTKIRQTAPGVFAIYRQGLKK